MPRWSWLKDRDQKLKSGTLEDLLSDINYCREREKIAKLKWGVTIWQRRRRETENVIIERFGEDALMKRR